MAFNLAKLFKSKTKDTLIFQVSEEFIEVAAVRRLDDAVSEGGGATCFTDLIYTQRLPRVVPAKKTFDDLALNIGKLADSAVVARELVSAGFVIGEANVVCIFVAPLSRSALMTYSATLKKQTKITNKIFKNVFNRGEISHDEMQDVPTEYAVYAESLTKIELNGYSTSRPLGKVAKRIGITFAKHLAIPALWSATGGVLEQTFHRELKYMHKEEVITLDSPELCDEIYTGSELQEISSAIL